MTTEQRICRLLKRYAVGTLSYGFIHSAACEYSKTKHFYQQRSYNYVAKEKLLIDKLGRTALGTAAAPVAWPLMVNYDLIRLDCLVRGKDAAEYGR
jgi:hypothetical protein